MLTKSSEELVWAVIRGEWNPPEPDADERSPQAEVLRLLLELRNHVERARARGRHDRVEQLARSYIDLVELFQSLKDADFKQ